MGSKLWGGRFNKPTDKAVEEFTRSIGFDQALAKADCLGSLCHIEVLKRAKLLSNPEHARLKRGLTAILNDIKKGKFKISKNFEDIHSYIQFSLKKRVGSPADKLQTCRSRNDQVVLATEIYSLEQIQLIQTGIKNFRECLKVLAHENRKIFMPGYTHLQHAMPVSLADYFLAYDAMLARDTSRLEDTAQRIHLTMGSGALAGTIIPASKYFFPAREGLLKGITPPENAIDTVSNRDFVIEILSALAVLGMHLSRLSEDLILWATKEFDFIEIDDSFCTGSSLMPQKKNPDVLELIRGYAGRLYGRLIEVLVVMKGLPLSYNRDMQLDKEPLFDAFRVSGSSLAVLTDLLRNLKFNIKNIERNLNDEALYASDMADYLVSKGMPFHQAHAVIGKLIQYKNQKNKSIKDMTANELYAIHPLLGSRSLKPLFNPRHSVLLKKSIRRKRA